MKIEFDPYTRKARLFPALLTILPIGFAVVTWFPEKFLGWGLLTGLFTACGGMMLLAQVGRDQGKKREAGLWESWGGPPTTQLLRHRNNAVNEFSRAQWHAKLQALLPYLKIPSTGEENEDPERADRVYEECVRFLRSRTRDRARYPLVFAENVSYGFRRNLWGMKAFGVVLATLGVMATGARCFHVANDEKMLPVAVMGLCINLIALGLWLFIVKEEWVRTTANAYAERLLESVDGEL